MGPAQTRGTDILADEVVLQTDIGTSQTELMICFDVTIYSKLLSLRLTVCSFSDLSFMSSALPPEQSRSWWSLSSKSSKQDFHTDNDKPPSKNSSRNLFSSLISRKSKKHPTLPIEEPPSPLQSPTPHVQRTNLRGGFPLRSPLSPAESIEPLTPVDGFREGQRSLLALDHDPFGARGLVARGPTSPSTFSTHSNSSFLDIRSRPDKSILYFRPSYSSSSSNSNSVHESQSSELLKVHSTNVEEKILSPS